MWSALQRLSFSNKALRMAAADFPPKNPSLTVGLKVQVDSPMMPCALIESQAIPELEEMRVDMADMKVERRPVTLVTNVGSCIAICLHDSINNCGGLAHIMLPKASNDREFLPYKYADTAVPGLAESIRKLAKGNCRVSAKIAGGANMFSNLKCHLFNIGERNVEAVEESLSAHGIPLLARDVGGTCGRRISFNVVNGLVIVRSLNEGEKKL